MDSVLALLMFIALAVSGAGFDEHSNEAEKKAADEVVISQAVRIGAQQLAPGRYRLTCDRQTITFDRIGGKRARVQFPCQGAELPEKSAGTQVHMEWSGGELAITRVVIRGSNVEHVF